MVQRALRRLVSTLYTGFALLSILTIRTNARGLATIPPPAVQDVLSRRWFMSRFRPVLNLPHPGKAGLGSSR